jgi:hypothetical protein
LRGNKHFALYQFQFPVESDCDIAKALQKPRFLSGNFFPIPRVIWLNILQAKA